MPITIVKPSLQFGPMKMLDKSAIRYLVVHTEGAPGNADGSATSIHTYHRLPKPKGNGWSGIGYHFVIRKSGTVEQGRPLDRQGAHVDGVNRMALGICCSGHGDLSDFTPAQKQSLRDLVRDLKVEYPQTSVEGHRPLVDKLLLAGQLEQKYATGKTCPGTRVSMDELRQLIGMEAPETPQPQPGDRRWSGYFKEWLILVRYVSDAEWYFVRDSQPNAAPTRAHAKWSDVPLGPPVLL
jgi:N-acetyl-anhydromuramyl-L-alanine amidase AmpD